MDYSTTASNTVDSASEIETASSTHRVRPIARRSRADVRSDRSDRLMRFRGSDRAICAHGAATAWNIPNPEEPEP